MTNKELKKFALIEPAQKMVRLEEFTDLNPDAFNAAGLTKGVDFGAIAPNHSIVVYEFGLFVKPEDQHFFAIGRSLYAGNAVIFCEVDGKPADVDPEFYNHLLATIRFFNSSKEVEDAIEAEEIIQPSLSIGDETVWVWPQPAPEWMLEPDEKEKEE